MSPRAWSWLLVLAAGTADAKVFCCNDDQGHRICGSPLPIQCQSREHREMGPQGETRRVEKPLTREERLRREAEEARQKELEKRAAEEQRRNKALLSSYGSEKDIDIKRDKALADLEKGLQLSKENLEEALKHQKRLASEAEFYRKKQIPAQLQSQIKDNEMELAAHQAAIEAKMQEMERVRVRFEAEKQRYLELTHGRGAPPPALLVPR